MSYTILNTPDRSGHCIVAVNTNAHKDIIHYLKTTPEMAHYLSKKTYTKEELETFNQLFNDVTPYRDMRDIEIFGNVDSKWISDAYYSFLSDIEDGKRNADNAMDQYLLSIGDYC